MPIRGIPVANPNPLLVTTSVRSVVKGAGPIVQAMYAIFSKTSHDFIRILSIQIRI